MKRFRAFTLIELLTVIAIIAILAAIIFPVFARAKATAYKNSDLSAMNQLRNALQLYRVDQGGYPPALLGYVSLYNAGGGYTSTNVVPANATKTYLYPKRVESLETFRPSYLRAANSEITTAVWPNKDPRPVGQAPVYDVNGDGVRDNKDDTAGTRQLYGPTNAVTTDPGNPASPKAYFYKISGYDTAEVTDSGGGKRAELHYALFWSDFGLKGGSGVDDPRQLGYNDPPESTVITWNSFFRDPGTNGPSRQKSDMILFLGGGAKYFDSRDVFERSWRVIP